MEDGDGNSKSDIEFSRSSSKARSSISHYKSDPIMYKIYYLRGTRSIVFFLGYPVIARGPEITGVTWTFQLR